MYYVYVLQSLKDEKYYTGFARDLRDRIEKHNKGGVIATKNRIPLKLVYLEGSLDKSDSLRREVYLKTAWGKRYLKKRIKSYLDKSKK